MGKVILVFGKICSGKSHYAKRLQQALNAVILSPDEATYELIDNVQGEFYEIFTDKLIRYLSKKSAEIALAGADVIYERGLWSRAERAAAREYYKSMGVDAEFHYVSVDDASWKINIEERNRRIREGNGGADFYLDEGLMGKLMSRWEEPEPWEYDVIVRTDRGTV